MAPALAVHSIVCTGTKSAVCGPLLIANNISDLPCRYGGIILLYLRHTTSPVFHTVFVDSRSITCVIIACFPHCFGTKVETNQLCLDLRLDNTSLHIFQDSAPGLRQQLDVSNFLSSKLIYRFLTLAECTTFGLCVDVGLQLPLHHRSTMYGVL
jgi:hypothetical protein